MGEKFRIFIVIEPGDDPRFPKFQVYSEPIGPKSDIHIYQALAEAIAMMKKIENDQGEVNERDLRKVLGKMIGPYPVKEVLSVLLMEGVIFRPRKGMLKWTS